MKLNRVFSVVALFGLLSGAGMAAQAQTRFTVRIGTPAAAVVASYAPQYYGNGNVWISGYFDGMQWIPGYWMHRVDSRYRNENHYSDRNVRIRNDYGRNHYGRNDYHSRNDRNYRRNGNDRGNQYNQRDHRNNDRGNHYGRNGWNNGRDHQGGRH